MKKSTLPYIVIAAVLLLGLLLWLKPPRQEMSLPVEPAAAPAAPLPRSFDWVVNGGKVTAGPTAMQVHEGEDVAIKVTADRADELHLHGYELGAKLEPNAPAALYFKATHTGRFDLELHKSGLQLGSL